MRISDWSSDVCSSDLDRAVEAYAAAAVKSENSLALLNVGQALITNAMLGGGMAFVAWGWSQGRFSAGDVVFVSTLLSQLFRSEERRVGKECVGTFRFGWSPGH